MTNRRIYFTCNAWGKLPVANMLDAKGEFTDVLEDARTVVAQLPNNHWVAAQCFPGEVSVEYLQ